MIYVIFRSCHNISLIFGSLLNKNFRLSKEKISSVFEKVIKIIEFIVLSIQVLTSKLEQ